MKIHFINLRLKNYLLLIVFTILNLAATDFVLAGENPAGKSNKWGIDLRFGSMYDNNILKYSDKYIERFKNLEDPGRFHINRYDDLVLDYSLGLSYTDKIFWGLKTILLAEANYNEYSYNSIKSWTNYSVGWRQYIGGSASFMISYTHIPRFYVRHFRDEDWVVVYEYTPETFQPYEFAKDDYSFWFQYYITKGTRLRLYFSYMQYFLNKSNTEYDSNDVLYGFRAYQKITDDIKINFGYKYATSDAKGYDELTEIKSIADDADATNYEHTYIVGCEVDLPRIFNLRNDFSVTFQHSRQFFTTSNYLELDPIHAGRYDYDSRIYANYDIRIYSDLSLRVFYNWIYRDSGTSAKQNNEYLSDEKDYKQSQVGINLKYKFEF